MGPGRAGRYTVKIYLNGNDNSWSVPDNLNEYVRLKPSPPSHSNDGSTGPQQHFTDVGNEASECPFRDTTAIVMEFDLF